MAELGTRCTHRKGAGRKLSAYGCARRISTRRAGHVFRGGTRELGRAICVLAHMPGVGDRVTKGPGVGWALRPGHEPCGETTNEGSRQGTGEPGEVRPKRPTGGKATSGRACQEVRYTRETLRSPIVSPHPSWTVSTG